MVLLYPLRLARVWLSTTAEEDAIDARSAGLTCHLADRVWMILIWEMMERGLHPRISRIKHVDAFHIEESELDLRIVA
jgi:hypothetical protein